MAPCGRAGWLDYAGLLGPDPQAKQFLASSMSSRQRWASPGVPDDLCDQRM